jgi:EAL domain-containing protein (putative c-di-GMP-specific phosphodiesterase class I)
MNPGSETGGGAGGSGAPKGPPCGRVLIVDDEASLRRIIARILIKAGHDAIEASDGQSALTLVASQPFDVIISDIGLPGLSGIELLKKVREYDLDVPMILMSGLPDVGTALQAVEYGALQYLIKPLDLARLEELVARALKVHRVAKAKRSALESFTRSRPPSDRVDLDATFDRVLQTMWLAFQPIVRAQDGALFGYEALLRSQESSLPHPRAILAAGEKLGRRAELGRAIRAKAASLLAGAPRQAVLFVNLHPHDLSDDHLISEDAPLSKIASRVVLEITERASLEDVTDAQRRVASLRAMGFRIAIDDLGAGYAGLTTLAQLEPEIVKLDMSIVRDVDTTPTKQKLVRSITSLCEDMGMLVVSEGVETRAEKDTLIALGTDLIQGFLVAKPGKPFPQVLW